MRSISLQRQLVSWLESPAVLCCRRLCTRVRAVAHRHVCAHGRRANSLRPRLCDLSRQDRGGQWGQPLVCAAVEMTVLISRIPKRGPRLLSTRDAQEVTRLSVFKDSALLSFFLILSTCGPMAVDARKNRLLRARKGRRSTAWLPFLSPRPLPLCLLRRFFSRAAHALALRPTGVPHQLCTDVC